MGSYDGAETCELVGLYMLSQLEQLGINNNTAYEISFNSTALPDPVY